VSRENPGHPPEPDDSNLGEPIAELANWAEPVPAELLERVRASIHRRETVAAAVDLSFGTLGTVFLAFIQLLAGLVEAAPRREPEED